MVRAAITGAGVALPPAISQQRLWDEFFGPHYDWSPLAGRVWRNSGIQTRHGVIDPRVEDVRRWSTGARMRRFLEEATPLGKEAVSRCLDDAGIEPSDVGVFAVASCTGYAAPGLDVLLARDLGMDERVQRLHLGHMGCHAALPGLGVLADAVAARGKLGVLLCIELASLHVQPPTDDVDQIVASALFSDAAAAVAVAPDAGGLEFVDVAARTEPAASSAMTWEVTDLGFRMRLSAAIPDLLAGNVREVVGELLAPHGLSVPDVARWAVHPGGPRILDVVADRLGLDAGALEESREVLRRHGNCSSPTVLLILEQMLRGRSLQPGNHVVALAFGPGPTLYAVLLRHRVI